MAFTHTCCANWLILCATHCPLCLLEEMNVHYTGKESHITPPHKKGSKGEPNILVAKCMEAFIREAVLEHMMATNLFSDDQHGFVQGRSCMTQLLTVLRDWTNGLALWEM